MISIKYSLAALARRLLLLPVLLLLSSAACAQAAPAAIEQPPTPAPEAITTQVVDVATRPGVTQRLVYLSPPHPRASLILFAGGNGGLRITPDGSFSGGGGNFLVRTRQLFAEHGYAVAVVDAPSDHQMPPYLGDFRLTPQHVSDIQAVMVWLRQQAAIPVWLVGTSRGTLSAAFVATQLDQASGGPDGLVLTSTVLRENRGGLAVPDMPLQRLRIPVLVLHHEQDGCKLCSFSEIPHLMAALSTVPQKELIAVQGGVSRGDPCEARAYHGYNGIEPEVVSRISDWIGARRQP